MSVSQINAAWQVRGITSSQKLVLVCLADNANDAGFCWPSLSDIRARCCMEERAVQRAMAALEKKGMIRRIFRKGRSTQYWLEIVNQVSKMTPPPKMTGVSPVTPTPPQNDTPPPPKMTPITIKEPFKEPSLKKIDKKKFPPPPEIMLELRAKFPSIDVDGELESYVDWLAANGKRPKDRIAGFRNWLRNCVKWQKPEKKQTRAGVTRV